MAVLSYNVNFKKTGKHYIWFKGYATHGSDNSVHVGVNNKWPNSGKKLYMCEGSWNKWSWSSHQLNNSEGCGSRKRIYINIEKLGMNKVMFSMREDGIEFDKFIVTQNETFIPN